MFRSRHIKILIAFHHGSKVHSIGTLRVLNLIIGFWIRYEKSDLSKLMKYPSMNDRDIQYINLRKFARQFIEMPIETRLFISAITISNGLPPLISSLLIRRFLPSVPLALRKPLLYPAINNSIVRQYFFLHFWQMRAVIAIGGRLPLLVFAIIMIERWNTLASKKHHPYI